MIDSRRLFWICVGLALLPAAGYFALRSFFGAAGLAVLVGLLWALGEAQPAKKSASTTPGAPGPGTLSAVEGGASTTLGAPGSSRWLRTLSVPWLSDLCFGLALALAAACVFTGAAWPLALVGALAALAAWDLRSFRLRVAAQAGGSPAERPHLAALAAVMALSLGAALLLAAAARWWNYNPGIGLAWLLGLLAAGGLIGLGRIWLK